MRMQFVLDNNFIIDLATDRRIYCDIRVSFKTIEI